MNIAKFVRTAPANSFNRTHPAAASDNIQYGIKIHNKDTGTTYLDVAMVTLFLILKSFLFTGRGVFRT